MVKALALAKTEAHIMAEAIAMALTTPLHNLATDCLRFSMHFFHPVQQCAQQVYHTAVPLSPTSSHLHGSCLQSVIDNQLSHVTAFSGAPDTWGLLLRTIDVRPMQLTCIATSAQRIIAACEATVNIYDAVTFVLQQSLCTPERVTSMEDSPDGSILFFAHYFSITMWDVQTGGLIYTFTTQTRINNIAVSSTGEHIACGSPDGSVAFWNIHTKKEGKGFGDSQPVVTIIWLSPLELAVATQGSVYIHDIGIGRTSDSLLTPGPVWGMVHSVEDSELLVGTSQPGKKPDQVVFTLEPITYAQGLLCGGQQRISSGWGALDSMPLGQLKHPTLVDNGIACITPPSGVQLFNTRPYHCITNPSLLDAATSVAMSLNRNLVVQTKDSIQIFSINALMSHEDDCDDSVRSSHIYLLGENHVVCVLQPARDLTLLESETLQLTLLELETLQEPRPDGETSLLGSLFTDHRSTLARASLSRGLVAEFDLSLVMRAWESGTPLPEWTEAAEWDVPLSGLSPQCTRIIVVQGSPRRELHIKDVKGDVLANLTLGNDDLWTGKVYDLTFDSETRFYLKIDGPGRHFQIPYNVIASPSGCYSHTITQGEPIPLPEPRPTPPYTLDANCEWVIDAGSRKICWIPPGNVRRGNGGHFWAGSSLVMVGDDGVVRKLSFKEPGR